MRVKFIRLTIQVLKALNKNLNDISVYFNANLKNTHGIKNINYMTRIHDDEVKNIAEYNLLHYIINPPKCTKKLDINYSHILHGYIKTRKYG